MGFLSLFRPKPRADENLVLLANILESGNRELIFETTRQVICGLDPNGCVQLLVGYKNVKHIYLLVSKQLRRELDSNIRIGVRVDVLGEAMEEIESRSAPTLSVSSSPCRRKCGLSTHVR
jgi:hypothetical protein